MKNEMSIRALGSGEVSKALEQVGASVLFANKTLGCALAFVNKGKGIERKTHQFTTSNPITPKGALTRTARKELAAAGILSPLASNSFSSTKRLVARGAMAAAFSGALLLSGGVNNAMAQDLGFTYFGGTNPLAEVTTYNNKPAFVDIDGDGDLDCFVGEYYGHIDFWKNNGTKESPNFTRIQGDGNPLTNTAVSHMAAPTFVDIDGDGDMDAFIGQADTRYKTIEETAETPSIVTFIENTGTRLVPVFNADAVTTDTRKTITENPIILNGTHCAAPTFVDIDDDGDMDAFVGDYYGHIYGFENLTINNESKAVITGTVEFANRGILEDYSGSYIQAYGGFAAPSFVDIDGDGDMDLFVGNKYGTLQYFENTGSRKSFEFTESSWDDNPFRVSPGPLASPAFVDINDNGVADLFCGQEPTPPIGENKADEEEDYPDYWTNYVRYYQNVGTKFKSDFRSRGDNPFNLGPAFSQPLAAFGDIDGDGDLDAVVGCSIYEVEGGGGFKKPAYGENNLKYYENVGTVAAPEFALWSMESNPWDWRSYWYMPSPAIADLNGDKVNEVYVGYTDVDKSGDSKFFGLNRIGAYQFVTSTKQFEEAGQNPLADLGNLPDYPNPAFVDIDGDGDLDLFVSGEYNPFLKVSSESGIEFFRNDGTSVTPSFTLVTGDANPLTGVTSVYYPRLSFADVDGDGDQDVVMSRLAHQSVPVPNKDIVEEDHGDTRYFKNVGTKTNPVFEEQDGDADPFEVIAQKTVPGAITLADLDGDEDVDAIAGDSNGKLYYYRNVKNVDEAISIVKHNDDWLCFVESAKSDSSLWDKIADSCKQGAHKIRSFFSPS